MIRSNSDTATSTNSPTPISPFSSNYSVPSEPTSDETPDLGAFNVVLRALSHLQPPLRIVNSTLAQQGSVTSTSSFHTRSSATTTYRSSALESDSDLKDDKSTVWSHRPIASYLSLGDTTTTDAEAETDHDHEYRRNDDTEGEENYAPRMVEIEDMDELDSSYDNEFYDNDNEDDIERRRNEPDVEFNEDEDGNEHELSLEDDIQDLSLRDVEDQPSLGYLDEALSFIAAERERWNAQREAGASAGTGAGGTASLLAGIEPRRKRRRKRTKTPRAHSTTRTPTSSTFATSTSVSTITASSATQIDDVDADADADDSSSSYDQQYSSPSSGPPGFASIGPLYKSTPGTPSHRSRGRPTKQRKAKLKHSRSTPQLRVLTTRGKDGEEEEDTDPAEDTPRVAQLRYLGEKLEKIFPEDEEYLRKVQYKTLSEPAASSAVTPGGAYFDSYVDGESTSNVLGGFVDTRGPPPKEQKGKGGEERLIHVFVDHSNILIGLINYLKRNPRQHPQYRENNYSSQSSATSPSGNHPGGSAYITSPYPKPPKHLSHSALALILERGRPVTRRVLVTSSPLYQPMESAERLGYEVRVFARVPDLGDGMDRERERSGGATGAGGNERRFGMGHRKSVSSGSFSGLQHDSAGGNGGFSSTTTMGNGSTASPRRRGRSGSVNNQFNGNHTINNPPNANGGGGGGGGRRRGHSRKVSGNTSTESEQGVVGAGNGISVGFPHAFVRSLGSAPVPINGGNGHVSSSYSGSLPASNMSTPSVSTPNSGTLALGAPTAAASTAVAPTRVRYREQGVDELLQLKLHQALASIDGPPPKDSTIVLATGDGNTGQFNEDGFLGSVRTALKRGWKVELYAWEGGLSRAWKREFGEGSEWGISRAGSGSGSGSGSDGKGRGKGDEGPRFRVIGMEQFGSELVEIYY